MLKLLFAVAFCAAVVSSQEMRRCVAPAYFESRVLSYDHLTNFYRRSKFYYDSSGERIRLIEETAANQTKPARDILVLYRENMEFEVDVETGKCTKSAPHHTFEHIEVTEGHHFAEELIIGSYPDDGVRIAVWYKSENTTTFQGLSVVEFTAMNCLPFYESYEGTLNKEKIHFHRTYFDVVTQWTDPGIFHIPEACFKP